nr:retrovirus-related Pol polyprotein LINE-1 [Tanacetum cinerariifolium]
DNIDYAHSNGYLRPCPSVGVAGYRHTRRVGKVASSCRIWVCSWNIGTLTGKFFELVDALRRKKVDIACFQETKWKGSRTREGNQYKLWISDRIMLVRLVIEEDTTNVISAYASQQLIIAGDLNGHIRANTDGFSSVNGGFGYGVRNKGGRTILEFAAAHDMVVVNSFFKNKDAHLITFHSGDHDTQIDYIRAAEERYKEAKREAKKAVARVKEKAYEDLYKILDSKEGENDIYGIAKARDRRKKDLGNVRFIKDKDGRSIVNEDAIRRRWEEYFSDLFNGHLSAQNENMDSIGPDEIPIEAWRGIKLLSHTMKLWERVIERRLRRETEVSENQFGLMMGRCTMNAIHIIRSLMKKYRERQKDLHLAFLDIEKAYDNVPRELIWKTLSDKGTPTRYINVAQDMSESDRNKEEEIRIGEHILEPKESFRYLGSVTHKSRRIEDDVTHRIQVGWLKWRAATGILCDKKVPLKLKGKFYRVAIRPAMMYGSECWPLMKVQAYRMEVAEMRMLRWTCGKTIFAMIPNGVVRTNLQVVTIVNKMREGRLRWFGHVKRRPQSTPVRRVESLTVDGTRRRGRPKLRWEDKLKTDLNEMLLSEDMTSDRNTWRTRIRVDEVVLVHHCFLPVCAWRGFLACMPLCRYVIFVYACLVCGFFACFAVDICACFRCSRLWYVGDALSLSGGLSESSPSTLGFKREFMKGSGNADKMENVLNKSKPNGLHKEVGKSVIGKSFMSVVKDNKLAKETESSPAIVLEDDCLNARDLYLSLMGRVKELASLANLKKALCNEGFDGVKISYLGELWILLEFETTKANDSFRGSVGAGSWFLVCENIYESFKIVFRGKVYWVRASEVPGWTLEFSEEEEEDNVSVEENERGDNLFVNLEVGKDNSNSVNKNLESTCSGRFKESKTLRTGKGGSILSIMEDVVKVGQSMGYNMDGCIKDITVIIESQGEFGVNR